MAKLKADVLPGYFDELPSDETLRSRFKAARVPFIKCNRAAKRGGGVVFWDIAAVEKHLRSALRPEGALR